MSERIFPFLPLHPDIRRVLSALTRVPESTAYLSQSLASSLRGMEPHEIDAALEFLASCSLARKEGSPRGVKFRATKRGREEMLRYHEARVPGLRVIARA